MGELWVRNVIIRKAPRKRPPPSYLSRMDGERQLFESGLFAYFLSLTVLNSTALNFVDFGLQIPFKIQSSNLQASYTSSLLSHVYNVCASSSPDSITLDWDRNSKPCSRNPDWQDSWAHRQFSGRLRSDSAVITWSVFWQSQGIELLGWNPTLLCSHVQAGCLLSLWSRPGIPNNKRLLLQGRTHSCQWDSGKTGWNRLFLDFAQRAETVSTIVHSD